MSNYGRTSGTGGLGSSAISNDDKHTADFPDDEDTGYTDLKTKTYNKIKDPRSF